MGKGPTDRGLIDPKWRVCNNGVIQSPIDLLGGRVEVHPEPAPISIKNRAHDISVRDAGKIAINGTIYKLTQCHWHSPSEQTVNGRRYNLEMHAVHMSREGKIAVIGIMYGYGRPDPFLAKVTTIGQSLFPAYPSDQCYRYL
ncbi:Alpha carbonic anhydrase 6-like protein [Drosera capensis]